MHPYRINTNTNKNNTLSIAELKAVRNLGLYSRIYLPNSDIVLHTYKIFDLIKAFVPDSEVNAIVIFGSAIKKIEYKINTKWFGLLKVKEKITKRANDVDIMIFVDKCSGKMEYELPIERQYEVSYGYGSWFRNEVLNNGLHINFTTQDNFIKALGDEESYSSNVSRHIIKEGIILGGNLDFELDSERSFIRNDYDFHIIDQELLTKENLKDHT